MRCDTNEIQKLTEEKKIVADEYICWIICRKNENERERKIYKESEFRLMMMINFYY